jgi:hypothetical protein
MTGYPRFSRHQAIVDADCAWFIANEDRCHRVRPCDPYEVENDSGQRCSPLPHYAVLRRGRYGQLQKILVPQPFDMGDLDYLTEEQAKDWFDWYVARLSDGVRDDFNRCS